MSGAEESGDTMMYCAACGTAEVDDVKLKKCTACHSRDHRPKHKRACKKRAAELRDEILFKQPVSSHSGDCPICCLPLSIDHTKSSIMACCSKFICNGCDYANKIRELEGKLQQKCPRERLQPTCPFCRHPAPNSEEEKKEFYETSRLNDPIAICDMGTMRGEEGDVDSAIEYWTKAAALGNIAHHNLSLMYGKGQCVEKDAKKELHHLEQAAIVEIPVLGLILGVMRVNVLSMKEP
ncbi:hypothetical protein QTG54_008931 [Skeletonema marinoi]|uniref:RING-type domain-containing protein n=1 Tax=Skeletonema marinoi TaxID=267567 RepID=A0AAD8Y776_9STRA|nr:hypothetical protein QTG54_008931 [Skeletonema marinoi]